MLVKPLPSSIIRKRYNYLENKEHIKGVFGMMSVHLKVILLENKDKKLNRTLAHLFRVGKLLKPLLQQWNSSLKQRQHMISKIEPLLQNREKYNNH